MHRVAFGNFAGLFEGAGADHNQPKTARIGGAFARAMAKVGILRSWENPVASLQANDHQSRETLKNAQGIPSKLGIGLNGTLLCQRT